METWDISISNYGGFFAPYNEVVRLNRSAFMNTQETNGSDQEAVILDWMQRCKDDLKEQVTLRAQEIFPDSIAYYKGIWERNQARFYDSFYPNGFPNFGYISIYGTFVDVGKGYTDTPWVFTSYGAPSNTAFNGAAKNGSFCWDTFNSTIYINRGTLESNSWEFFQAEDLVDYITNPLVLKRAFMWGVKYFMFEDRRTNDSRNSIPSLQYFLGQQEESKKTYDELVCKAMSQINMDISNGGIITSLDTKYQRSNVWAGV